MHLGIFTILPLLSCFMLVNVTGVKIILKYLWHVAKTLRYF